MTDSTPAAAPAAPAAVAAPATPSPETPVADSPPAAPAADSSLIPPHPAAAAPPAPPVTPPAADPTVEPTPSWFYADGTPGKGQAPVWYRADKYKTVEEQAKAYPELEKRFGAFTGAPKDGKYQPPPVPDGLEGNFQMDHPIFAEFTNWAVEHQFSQEGYNEVLGLLAKYEAARTPTMDDLRSAIGPDADARINAVAQWGQANLDSATYGDLRTMLSGEIAPAALGFVEKLIDKTRSVSPKPGDDVSVGILTEQSIRDAQAKVNPKTGKRFYDEDPKYRLKVEAQWQQYAEKLAI